MPHIIVKLWPGRSDEKKTQLVEKIVQAVTETFEIGEENVSLMFEEVKPEDWNEKVYKPDIQDNWNKLAKKPGYEMTTPNKPVVVEKKESTLTDALADVLMAWFEANPRDEDQDEDEEEEEVEAVEQNAPTILLTLPATDKNPARTIELSTTKSTVDEALFELTRIGALDQYKHANMLKRLFESYVSQDEVVKRERQNGDNLPGADL